MDAADDLETIGLLYRDRADCEGGFDKLKSQWRGGYHAERGALNLSVRAVAPIYDRRKPPFLRIS